MFKILFELIKFALIMDSNLVPINQIYGSRRLHIITQNLINWDFKTLHGIGFERQHDKYAHLEVTIEVIERETFSYLEWAVDPELLPHEEATAGKKILNNYMAFFVNHLEALKGTPVELKFKITKVGFHLADTWFKVCGYAFFNAIRSCFDEELYARNKAKSDLYFSKMKSQ